jgi:secreted Zn-dependent insulinase-like peptidase
LALPSDYHRKKQLITSLAKKGHPATKFSWGNVASLGGGGEGPEQEKKDSEVHLKLQKFREEHYVAKTMTLSVQSTHDLDTLQEWVVEYFSAVPSGNITETAPVLDTSLKLPFDTDEFKRIYYVAPVKDVKEVYFFSNTHWQFFYQVVLKFGTVPLIISCY